MKNSPESVSESKSTVPLASNNESVNTAAVAAAIEASSTLTAQSTSLVSYHSGNHVLVLGNDGRVSHVVSQLSKTILFTVLVSNSSDTFDIKSLPETVSVGHGTLSRLSGHLGEYAAEIMVNDKAVNLAQIYHPTRDYFDMVIDLTDKPVFSSSLLPFGYFSPKNEQELEEVIDCIPDMLGEFEKPKFFEYNADICAHGNSGLQACTRCIDVCPADAITSIKDAIAVNPYLCQGGGACATVCPSGAIQYVYPRLQDTLEKLRCMLKAYYLAGGQHASVVFYGEGENALLDQSLLSGYIPFQLEETASIGMEVWLSAFAYGAHEVVLLTHDTTASQVIDAIDTQLTYAHGIMMGMGFDKSCLHRESISDQAILATNKGSDSFNRVTAGRFMALNDKRTVLRMAVDHLYTFSTTSQETVNLPAGAPFGEIQVNKDKCTLCMACVSVCPASALADGDELPELRFSEANCVQCGLCSKACPEMAITLSSRYNYAPDLKRVQRILHEEAPFCCTACGKPFATQSVITNITAKLSKHPMFQTEEAVSRLKMCEDCRVRDMFSNELEAKH